MILADPRNPRAQALRESLRDLDISALEGVIVVIGGDGFMLHTVATYGLDYAYLGLNAGHLGFLLNDVEALATADLVAQVQERRWRESSFPLMEAEIHTVSGEVVVDLAINDVYLERTTGQTARLRLRVDGFLTVEDLVADGLIFATALGSTAYSFSAGGSPSHPMLRSLHVTPICPHQPRFPPFVLPQEARATVEVQTPERRPVRAVADGRTIDRVVSVTVGYSERSVRLAYLNHHDFTRQMLRKIVHP